MSTKKRAPLAERLLKSLEEGVAFARGEQDLAISIVPLGRDFEPQEIVAIRTKKEMSEAQFARALGVSVKTIQNWEQGKRIPSKAAMRQLHLVDEPNAYKPVFHPKGVRGRPKKSVTK